MINPLSDEAILEAIAKGYEVIEGVEMRVIYARAIAQAAHDNVLRQVAEWGKELCFDHNGAQRREQKWSVKRRECSLCWQELSKGGKINEQTN